MTVGTQIDLEFGPAASSEEISRSRPQTLSDLLNALQRAGGTSKGQLAMFRATAAHVMRCLNKPPDQIELEVFAGVSDSLRAHLLNRRFKRNAVRSYLNYAHILVRKAKELGWDEGSSEVQKAWKPLSTAIRDADSHNRLCGLVVQYAIRRGIPPSGFNEECLAGWTESALKRGRNYLYAQGVTRTFRQFVFAAGFGPDLPGLRPPDNRRYGVSLSHLPEPLRTEVKNILDWKTARYAPGRNKRGKNRPVSAMHLGDFICRFFGFLRKVRGIEPNCIKALVTEENLRAYVDWYLNIRKNRSWGLSVLIGRVHAALQAYPPMAKDNFAWIRQLVSELPLDPEDAAEESRRQRLVEYDVLRSIPHQIRRDIKRSSNLSERRVCLMKQTALIIEWLLTLPWRQRNLRECRIRPLDDGGNLFKGRVSPFVKMAKTKSVERMLRSNPDAECWQFYFRPDETKTGHPVRGFLPSLLVGPLEEFIRDYRPHLLRGLNHEFLFVSPMGRPLRSHVFRLIVEEATYRYAGRRVNPHLFRDIFAHKWLAVHPRDYLTLSKILWHRNLDMTLKYGRDFDESHGVRSVEEWLESLPSKEED